MSQRKSEKLYRVLAAAIAVNLCIVTLAVGEVICRLAYPDANDPVGTSILARDLAAFDGRSNRRVLGNERTAHGIFPEPPRIPSAPFLPLPPSYVPSMIGEKHFDPPSWGSYGSLPLSLPVRSARMWRSRSDGAKIYDLHFEIDRFARRMTPLEPVRGKNGRREDYLLFLGCSYTFGEGVSDRETLPYFTGAHAKRFHPYNYGLMGGSPGDAYFRLKGIGSPAELDEKTGWVVYVWMDDHILRMVGPLSMTSNWAGQKNHYFFDSAGELRTDGIFAERQALPISLYRWALGSSLFRWLKVDWPVRVRDSDWENVARIFAAMDTDARSRLHARGFAVVLFPGTRTARRLIPFLEAQKIQYIDYSNWDAHQLTRGHGWIPYDGHPSAQVHELIGRSLADEIEKLDERVSN